MAVQRRATGAGKVVVTIDARTEDENPERSRWQNLERFLVLLGLVGEIAGPDAEVFFDFGVVTIREVDLEEFVDRFRSSS